MKNNKGFTLIELLVVIAIIGVLSSIVLVSMGGARVDARNTARKADMRQLVTAQEMAYGTAESYQDGAGKTDGTHAIGDYLGILEDPKGGAGQEYVWLQNDNATFGSCTEGEYFCAYAVIEGADPAAWYAASEKGTKLVEDLPGSTGTCAGASVYGTSCCQCF